MYSYIHKQWWIKDIEKGGGNDISKVDLRILDSEGGGGPRGLNLLFQL